MATVKSNEKRINELEERVEELEDQLQVVEDILPVLRAIGKLPELHKSSRSGADYTLNALCESIERAEREEVQNVGAEE